MRPTGDVLGRVVNTFVRMAPEVIDADIEYTDGSADTLTGTPNHPFWVDAVRGYVPLGELEVGTELHVQGGGEAILVSTTWRQGEFEVFDFEVEGLHNLYVRGEGSDAAGVLVHNSTGGGKAIVKRYDHPDLGPSGRHMTVEVQDASGSLGEFHLTGTRKPSFEQADPSSFPAGTRSKTVGTHDLADPKGAVETGTFGPSGRRYKPGEHDCVTGGCDIIDGGNPGGPSVNRDAVRSDFERG